MEVSEVGAKGLWSLLTWQGRPSLPYEALWIRLGLLSRRPYRQNQRQRRIWPVEDLLKRAAARGATLAYLKDIIRTSTASRRADEDLTLPRVRSCLSWRLC